MANLRVKRVMKILKYCVTDPLKLSVSLCLLIFGIFSSFKIGTFKLRIRENNNLITCK